MRVCLRNTKTKKFWEIETQGSEQLIRTSKWSDWSGRSSDYSGKYKCFSSDDKCEKDAEKKVQAQLKKGFETYETPAPPDNEAYEFLEHGKNNDVFRIRRTLEKNVVLNKQSITALAMADAVDALQELKKGGVEMPYVAIRAAQVGKLNAIRWAVGAGISVDFQDAQGLSALHIASQKEEVKAVSLLLELGADVLLSDSSGITAAHHAAIGPSFASLQLLVDAGADLAHVDEKGRTPLAIACQHGRKEKREKARGVFKEIIRYLLPKSPALQGEDAEVPRLFNLGAGESSTSSRDPNAGASFVGSWNLFEIAQLDSCDDAEDWEGPETRKADEDHLFVVHDDGTCVFTRYGDALKGSWEAFGNQLKVTLQYCEPKTWNLRGNTLEHPDFDDEHGSHFIERYRRA